MCTGAASAMVKTGQGLVLGATTGSRPQLELLLAEGPGSRSLLLFSGLWDCVDIWGLDRVFSPLFGLGG